jgi:FlaA1/EpsC-like NDP-sugar epimerase
MLFPRPMTLPVDRFNRCPIWAIHSFIFAASGVLAFLLRFDFDLRGIELGNMFWAIPIWLVIKTIVFNLLELDRGGWQYASLPDVVGLAIGNLAGTCCSVPFIVLFAPHGFPRSVYVIDLLICACGTAGVRVGCRLWHKSRIRSSKSIKRILIYGAGSAGARLVSEINKNPDLGYDVLGFIDDDLKKRGQRIQSVPVLGPGSKIPAIAIRAKVEEILIAMPSVNGSRMATVLQSCSDARLRCQTIPSLAEIIATRALTPQIRDVAVEDLLGRTPVNLDESALREKLEDQVVMVTGAAGSIGSELCRQIARFAPHAIIGYEVSETPLFEIDREMKSKFRGVCFQAEIGSIQNRARLIEVMHRYRPSVLYHAAAYKHVPLMEAHLFEAAENNILGTENVALAAAEMNIADVVMISSDKAVRPANVMGATKRIAELVINSLQNGHTKYVSVRFGNVLGSNGSVVPIFKQQIACGGPITITHPDMKRFFMTIPEAVQLVLQASTMGKGGEIFVLDMGAQIRIVDLAKNLILLSGLRPDVDIRIEFTGVRPGEKLYEELSAYNEDVYPTRHQKVRIYSGPTISVEEMQARLSAIRRYCAERDGRRLLLEIKRIVPEYNPSRDILSRLLAPEDSGSRDRAPVSVVQAALA